MTSLNDKELPSTVKAYTGIVTTCLFLGGSLINIFSILTVTCYTKLSTKVFYLVTLNLFIANLILDAFYYPVSGFHIIRNWPYWRYSEQLCEWSSLSENGCTTVALLSLMLLIFDRYFVTIKKKVLPKKAVIIFSILIWSVSLCLHGTYSFSSNPKMMSLDGENVSVCNAFIGKPLPTNMSYYRTSSIINVVLLLITFLVVMRTGIYIWRGRLRGPVKVKKDIKQEFKISFILVIFTWMFYLIKFVVLIARGDNVEITPRVTVLVHVIGSLNSIIPGVICMMFSKHFRRSYLDIFRGCKNSKLRTKPKKNEINEALTNETPNKRYYQEIDSPPTFLQGAFKTFDTDVDLSHVSIDSADLIDDERKGPGCQNQSFESLDSKF